MSGWKLNAVRAAVAAAVVAGGYLCTRGAYDHTRPPPQPLAGEARAPVLAGADAASPPTCVRDAAGISCTEEILVVGTRKAKAPVLLSRQDPPPEPR